MHKLTAIWRAVLTRAHALRAALSSHLASFELTANWRSVLRHAWSVRFILLAALLQGFEVLLPLVPGLIDVPSGIFALLSFFITCAAFIARIVAQPQSLPAAPKTDPNPKTGE